ncbi:TPA: hypothetical protein RRW89_004993, partial [Klebsiella pneumoniae]|nr:hypothetical protein [Klebsiella pneumoniae]
MSTYKTGNPLGSAAVKDLFDNAENLDFALNSLTALIWTDRLGKVRPSFFGMETSFLSQMSSQESRFTSQLADQDTRFNTFIASSGYDIIGDYTVGTIPEGNPLTITEYNQLIRYNNELYKLTAATDIPFTASGKTDETWTATDSAHFVSVGDAALRQNLGSSEPGMGDDLVFTKYGISVGEYIRNSPVRLSNYKITAGTDVTTAFSAAANHAALSKKLFLVDVDCLISSVTLPGDLTMEIMPGKAISQLPGSGLKMLIAGGDNILIKSDGTGLLIGQEAIQGGINYGFWAEGVTSPRLEGVDVGHFKGFGAYFSNCTRPACIRSTVHDITGGYVETACGIYFTNCIEPYSERNLVTDVGANGIKFRADTLGQTVRGKSVGDRVYRAG